MGFIFNGYAQVYTAGDITAYDQTMGYHDSTNCSSICLQQFNFTINNSFMGDSIILKDQSSGLMITYAVNTTGMNPWNTNLMNPNFPSVMPDNMVSGGMAFFGGPPIKIICGPDTVFNVVSGYPVPVPNPCQYGNVSGKIYIDNNNDCVFNTGDLPLASVPAQTNSTVTSGSGGLMNGYSNSAGDYTMQLQQSWMTGYTVSIPTNYQFTFPLTSCNPLFYSYTTLPQTNVNFSLQCTSHIDVQSHSFGPVTVRPAIPFMLHPYVSNTGCDTASGVLTLVKDPNTTYNAALSSNPATYVNGDTLKWNFSNLTNLSTGAYWNSFMAGVHLTPTLAVNSGDTLCFFVSSTLLSADINAGNNQSWLCIPVVNSYDPNVKEVSPKGEGLTGKIPLSTNHLDYTIHFQNTGTAPAINISVIDTLDANVDPASFRILGASHIMNPLWLASNVVKFQFNNIMLADSSTNEAKSHGQLSYTIKLKPGLTVGTQIKNKASIYFDSNPAIVTNTTVNTLDLPNAVSVIHDNQSIQLYPNPADDQLMITVADINQQHKTRVAIYSISNQLVKELTLSDINTSVDISSLHGGIYLIKIMQGDQTFMRKLIKK